MGMQKMLRRAVVGAVAVGVSVGAMATGASAGPIETDQNKAEYWEEAGYGTCVKDDREVGSYTVPEAPEASSWTILVLKAGSGKSVSTVNDQILDPVEGATYTHSSGKGISHVILCYDDSYGGGGGGYES